MSAFCEALAAFLVQDWGQVDAETAEANTEAYEADEGPIVAAYLVADIASVEEIWIIQEHANRSILQALLPTEFKAPQPATDH